MSAQDTAPYTSAMSLGTTGAVHAATPSLVALCGAGMNHRSREPVRREPGEITCKRCLRLLGQ